MHKFIEQKWISYLERYGGQWTPRQMQTAETLFYGGALALFQLTILDDGPTLQHEQMLEAIGAELEEFTSKHKGGGST